MMDETVYLKKLKGSILEKRALVLKDGNILIAAMAFTYAPGSIEFFGIHPQYHSCGIQKLFLNTLLETYLPRKKLVQQPFVYAALDCLGHRKRLIQLGFVEKERLTEFGYPTQRFVFTPPKKEEGHIHEK